MKRSNNLNKLLKARQSFSARGSTCPICKGGFRECVHTLAQVDEWFEHKIFCARLARVEAERKKSLPAS